MSDRSPATDNQAERDLRRVGEFRNRLVAYMNIVLEHGDDFRWNAVDRSVLAQLGSERTWLGQEYGSIYSVINQYGSMMMTSPAIGVTSHDVIQDAIHDLADVSYRDIARITTQHLDTVIGRLRAEAAGEERDRQKRATEKTLKPEVREADPDRWYRATSPIYWLGRLVALLRWLIGTGRGRITAAVILLVGWVINGVVSGAAQAWFERVLAGATPGP